MSVQAEPTAIWPGYRVTDQGPWRLVECITCGKPSGFLRAGDAKVQTDVAVNVHQCGEIGTPWSTGTSWSPGAPSTAGAAHAFLLRSIAGEVAAVPVGTYGLGDVAQAAGALVEALESQLHAAEIASGLRAPEPGDPGYVGAMYAKRLSGRLGPDEPVYVSVGELVETGRLPDDPGDPSIPAVGVSWPSFTQCADHAIADLDRVAAALAPETIGLVLYGDPENVDCPGCTGCTVAAG